MWTQCARPAAGQEPHYALPINRNQEAAHPYGRFGPDLCARLMRWTEVWALPSFIHSLPQFYCAPTPGEKSSSAQMSSSHLISLSRRVNPRLAGDHHHTVEQCKALAPRLKRRWKSRRRPLGSASQQCHANTDWPLRKRANWLAANVMFWNKNSFEKNDVSKADLPPF